MNVVLAAAQIVGGAVAHSVSLLADAGHNLTDVAGIGVALLAARWALRPPSPARSFGYHRSTILAALANAAVIAAVTVAIAAAAIERIAHPHPVRGALVSALAAVALVANGAMAVSLHERGHGGHRHHDLNMRAAALHMAGDALGSLAVLGAGLAMVADPTLRWADPAASLAVAAVIVGEAYRLMRASVEVLLESSPPDVDIDALTATMLGVDGVMDVHDLHVWSLSSEVRALSAHVVLSGHPSLEEAQVTGDRVKAAVGPAYAIAHATIELECERCIEGAEDPCLMGTLTGEPPGGRPATT